jgi:hypothetical protein
MSEDKTKAEIIEEINKIEEEIESMKELPDADPDPGHDLYRAVMWLECINCGNRYVDGSGCAICNPGKEFLQKWRHKYPWKSDQK